MNFLFKEYRNNSYFHNKIMEGRKFVGILKFMEESNPSDLFIELEILFFPRAQIKFLPFN